MIQGVVTVADVVRGDDPGEARVVMPGRQVAVGLLPLQLFQLLTG